MVYVGRWGKEEKHAAFQKYVVIWMERGVMQWHVASLLLAAEFKRWNGFVRHTCMMTRDGEDEYFWRYLPQHHKTANKCKESGKPGTVVAAVEVAFPVSSYTHKLRTVRRSPVRICFIAASVRVSACAFFAPL